MLVPQHSPQVAEFTHDWPKRAIAVTATFHVILSSNRQELSEADLECPTDSL